VRTVNSTISRKCEAEQQETEKVRTVTLVSRLDNFYDSRKWKGSQPTQTIMALSWWHYRNVMIISKALKVLLLEYSFFN
jgi:hypothetical protein